MRPPVLLGVDRLLLEPGSYPDAFHPRARVGLVTSDGAPTGLGRRGVGAVSLSVRHALLDAGMPLHHLFSPEHGLGAAAPDGAAVGDGVDAVTGLPVTSLYGERFAPSRKELKKLDLLLFDLQDVGARFYTFLWTLSHALDACASADIPLWVLDRPNPLGGEESCVEGPLPLLDTPDSFLGRWPVPVRHGLTLGELALLLHDEMGVPGELRVVPMSGWRRAAHWPDTGIPFHPPSPGIPSYASALLYPGTALLEATNVEEGRGTPLAFRWLGARWLDPQRLVEALRAEETPGVRPEARPLLLPGSEAPLPGVVLEIEDARAVRPVALGLRLLALLADLFPSDFAWRPYPTADHPSGEGHLHRLLGDLAVAASLAEDPASADPATVQRWTRAPEWWDRAEPHLIYD